MLDHQPAHIRPEHRDHVALLDRLHGRRAALVLEQRELAEDIARAERRERDRTPAGMLADRASMAGANDVAGVARVALAEHHLPRLERTRNGEVGDPLEVLGLKRGEHRHACQQLHHLR